MTGPARGLEFPKGTSQCPMKPYRTRGVSPRGTGADSGNVRESRMTLNVKLRQSINEEAEYDGRATCSVLQTLHVACSVIHVSSRAFGDASLKTWVI